MVINECNRLTEAMCKSIQKREGMIDQKGFLILLQEFLGYKVRSHDKDIAIEIHLIIC